MVAFNFKHFDFDDGWLVGMLAGDGWATENGDIGIAKRYPEVKTKLAEVMQRYCPHTMRTYVYKKEFKGSPAESHSNRWYAPPFGEWIREHIGVGCKNKKLPSPAGMPPEFVVGCLSGLWDSDGTISFNTTAKGLKRPLIVLDSRSPWLPACAGGYLRCAGISDLAFREYERWGDPVYTLAVRGSGVSAFANTVTLSNALKAEKLNMFKDYAPEDRSLYGEAVTIDEAEIIKFNEGVLAYRADINGYKWKSLRTLINKAKRTGTITKGAYLALSEFFA